MSKILIDRRCILTASQLNDVIVKCVGKRLVDHVRQVSENDSMTLILDEATYAYYEVLLNMLMIADIDDNGRQFVLLSDIFPRIRICNLFQQFMSSHFNVQMYIDVIEIVEHQPMFSVRWPNVYNLSNYHKCMFREWLYKTLF